MAAKKKTAKKITRKTPQNTSTVVAVIDEAQDLKEIKIPKLISDDPRKLRFFYYFFNHESDSFGSYRGSAIKAGFSEEYADTITYLKPKWLSGFIGMNDFVELAETHLREVLMLPNVSQAMGAFGPIFKSEEIKERVGEYKNGKPKYKKRKIKVPVMKENTAVIKVKNDAAKLVLPAHDPARYGKNDSPKFSFSYNVKEVRQQFKPT